MVLLPRVRARLAFAERVQPLGALTLVAILCGTVAGLNSVLAAIGFAELRAWNRISILIAFLALAGLGLGVDTLLRRVRWRRPRLEAVAAVGVAGALALVALYDQTSDALIPDYPTGAASWGSDEAYFTRCRTSSARVRRCSSSRTCRSPRTPRSSTWRTTATCAGTCTRA